MKLNVPSPVQEIYSVLYKEKGLRVFVKRDDLIHPLISGNKWRKLKFNLARAIAEDKNHLVTFGGPYSNHLLATAALAKTHQLLSTGIVRGECVQNEILEQCTRFGMNLIFVDRIRYRDKEQVFQTLFKNDHRAYFIDEGGAGIEALKGCREIITELKLEYDHIVVAAGTGTTAAGILSAIQEKGLKTHLHVIPVLKEGVFIKEKIEEYLPSNQQLHLHTDYHFGGYAKYTGELLESIIKYYKDHQLLLDQVYTAKLVFGLDDLIRSNYFKPGEQLLWIHTGGLTGLLGIKEKVRSLAPEFEQILSTLLEK